MDSSVEVTLNDDEDHSLLIANSDNEIIITHPCYDRCICRPMFFSKKNSLKKRLWRSRVTSTSSTPRQMIHHQRQGPYVQQQQQQNYQMLSNETSTESYYYPHAQNCQQNFGVAREEESSFLSTTTAVLTNCCSNSNSSSTSDLYINSAEQQIQKSFRLLMNQLKKENQLETLCQAIEYGIQQDSKVSPHQYQATDCVLVPRASIEGEEPQVIACRLWRWNDLYDCNAIKRILSCPNEKDPIYVCCNPAHWSRIYQLGNFNLIKKINSFSFFFLKISSLLKN